MFELTVRLDEVVTEISFDSEAPATERNKVPAVLLLMVAIFEPERLSARLGVEVVRGPMLLAPTVSEIDVVPVRVPPLWLIGAFVVERLTTEPLALAARLIPFVPVKLRGPPATIGAPAFWSSVLVALRVTPVVADTGPLTFNVSLVPLSVI